MLRGPIVRREFLRRGPAAEPELPRCIHRLESVRGREHRIGWNAGAHHPLHDFIAAHHAGKSIEQIVLEVSEELLGRDALECEVIEVAAQERIEAFAAELDVEKGQEQPPLLVGHLAERGIGVAPAQVDRQHLIFGFAHGEAVAQGLQAQHAFHGFAPLAVHLIHDAAFQVIGETLADPYIAPRRVGHQIPRPGMRQILRR